MLRNLNFLQAAVPKFNLPISVSGIKHGEGADHDFIVRTRLLCELKIIQDGRRSDNGYFVWQLWSRD